MCNIFFELSAFDRDDAIILLTMALKIFKPNYLFTKACLTNIHRDILKYYNLAHVALQAKNNDDCALHSLH